MAVQFEFDLDKTLAAIAYLAGRDIPALDVYKLNKLLFLADKYHLVRYGRPITGDDYWALHYGPVPTRTYDHLKKFLGNEEDATTRRLAEILEVERQYANAHLKARGPVADVLSKSDLSALDRTAEIYGRKTFEELKAITHEMPAYRKAWESRPEGCKSALMTFEDFFEEDSEAIRGVYEEMLEDDGLRRAFPAR